MDGRCRGTRKWSYLRVLKVLVRALEGLGVEASAKLRNVSAKTEQDGLMDVGGLRAIEANVSSADSANMIPQ